MAALSSIAIRNEIINTLAPLAPFGREIGGKGLQISQRIAIDPEESTTSIVVTKLIPCLNLLLDLMQFINVFP